MLLSFMGMGGTQKHVMALVWTSEDNAVVSILCFYLFTGPRDQTELSELMQQSTLPSQQLAGP